MIYKVKRFNARGIAAISGGLTGAVAGGYLGNKISGKIDSFKARMKFNPKDEAKKQDDYAEWLEDYIKELKGEKKVNWTGMREIPTTDNINELRKEAQAARERAKDIMRNPKKWEKIAGEEAEKFRDENPDEFSVKMGSVLGAGVGAILPLSMMRR
jgi:alcohol dehydrogenase class IV